MEWVAGRLSGGIGNRLFQHASAMGLAEKLGKEAVFFLPQCAETEHGPFESIFKLFPSTRIVETAAEWGILREPVNEFYKYVPFPEEIMLPSVIHGWRQTEKYFPKGGIHVDWSSVSCDMKPSEKAWFVHVRLGDYKKLPHHQIDLTRYYIHCLQNIPRGSTLYLFSDEPDLCKGFFDHCCTALDLNFVVYPSKDELESLYAMSCCKGGAITANSSFSWWGAYFAKQGTESFTAFYPSSWGNGQPPLVDTIPSWGTRVEP